MRTAFGEFELDDETFELRRGESLVAMEPQVFDVLLHLARNPGRVVTKEELLDTVWGDRFVSESALTSRIKAVRQALGDDGRTQRFVKTVHGRGYRFVGDPVPVVTSAGGHDVPRPATTPDHNLPSERTPLFGREDDTSTVTELVGEHRLVSLLGIGGSGKTRLAVAAGHRLLDGFDDGVWFVDLVPVTDQRSVDTAIAHAAGLALSTGDPLEQLATALSDRSVLFVLDNCEHVRQEVATTVDHLLNHTAKPRFLVTSREPIDLPDERRFLVEPLTVQGAEGDGPALALLRSAAERVGVRLDRDQLPALRSICERLDGIPLAIELAAAQLRALSAEEVLSRLDRRFELLRTRAAPGHGRRSDLVSVLEQTWSLLEPEEAELLSVLAGFPGPFDLVDVEQLCDDSSGAAAVTLTRLVDRSLVTTEEGEVRRHRLLETVRLFAQTRSDPMGVADRHADWCLDRIGHDIGRHVFDFDVARWCGRHWDDLGAAERHLLAIGRDADAARVVAGTGLAMHVDLGARAADTLRRIDEHLARVDDPALRARLHVAGAHAAMAARAPADIARHGHAAVATARESADEQLLAIALVHASWSTVFDDAEHAVEMVESAARLATEMGDPLTRDLADGYRAFHLCLLNRYDEAITQAEDVLTRGREPGFDQATFVAMVALAAITAVSDPHGAARWSDALLSRPAPGETMWANVVLVAAICAATGELGEAVVLVDQARSKLDRAGQDWLPDLLVPAALMAHQLGDDHLAARWLRAVRDAGRPTQSFQVTVVYRRIREVVGLSDDDPLSERTLDEIGEDALAWMHERAG